MPSHPTVFRDASGESTAPPSERCQVLPLLNLVHLFKLFGVGFYRKIQDGLWSPVLEGSKVIGMSSCFLIIICTQINLSSLFVLNVVPRIFVPKVCFKPSCPSMPCDSSVD
uniref:Uncharacterized protein n=1 Tax=Rhizophora mucronata TaxID=61149 RepID=A0A2P2QMH6_RHIMU